MKRIALMAGLACWLVAAGCGNANNNASTPTERTARPRVTSTATWATAPSTSTANSEAECALDDINGGLTAAGLTLSEPQRFGCNGNWAYAYTTGSPTPVVLQANGPRWSVTDTATACAGTSLPDGLRGTVCR